MAGSVSATVTATVRFCLAFVTLTCEIAPALTSRKTARVCRRPATFSEHSPFPEQAPSQRSNA